MLSISAWQSKGNILGAKDSRALEELVTDYFIQDSSDEQELGADEDSESETEGETFLTAVLGCTSTSDISHRLTVCKMSV